MRKSRVQVRSHHQPAWARGGALSSHARPGVAVRAFDQSLRLICPTGSRGAQQGPRTAFGRPSGERVLFVLRGVCRLWILRELGRI